jgi:predicted ATPase
MKSNQLDWISIEGFKSVANSGKIQLRPINLVIGANGAGKSNLLQSIKFFSTAYKSSLSQAVVQEGGADELLYLGVKVTREMLFQFALKNSNHTAELRAIANGSDDFERFIIRVHVMEAHNTGQKLVSPAETGALLTAWRQFHFHDTGKYSPFKKTNKVDDNDYLRPDGSNLAAFLYRLQIRFPNDYKMIVKTVQRIAPFFEDFLLRPDNLNPEFIKLAWVHQGTDKYFGASALSDGTLRFIALATLLLQPPELRPSVILIDEPELGLHPAAIALLASMIHSASVDTQVIAATQSPILLDYFEPEDILVAERKDGGTAFNRLNSDDYAHWLQDYSLGQLWEKNYLGGRPHPEHQSA